MSCDLRIKNWQHIRTEGNILTTLWLFNIAMENMALGIDGLPIVESHDEVFEVWQGIAEQIQEQGSDYDSEEVLEVTLVQAQHKSLRKRFRSSIQTISASP